MDPKREVRSFLVPRDPSIDRRFRPCPQKRERLFDEIEEENDGQYESDSDSTEECEYEDTGSTESISPSVAEETGALVYLRLKPVETPSPSYSISVEGKILIAGPSAECASSSKNKNSIEKHYSFSDIFDADVSQQEVYEKCIEQKIQAEESFTVLSYGTSGSGKTFTLLGDDIRPGIIPRSLENIFTLYQENIHPNPLAKLVNARTTFLDDSLVEKESLLRRQVLDNCKNLETNYLQLQQSILTEHKFLTVPIEDASVFIWISYVEIYNELVYDLLAPIKTSSSFVPISSARKNLKILCNDGNVFIKGVTSIHVRSSLEALKLLRSGLQKLTYASTSINANSSRSHCIFFVDVLKYYSNGVYTETSYKFCDLAGSERLDKTGNVGFRLKEAQRINTSLMILGRCLDAANNISTASTTTSALGKKERIPYRESKLTMLLQAALQGKEKLAMIVNLAPMEKFYEENLNVLNFASIARNIIFKTPAVKQNQTRYSLLSTTADNSYVQRLLEENANLKADIAKLSQQVEQQLRYNEEQNQQLEEAIDESYHLKEEIERMQHQHAHDMIKQEQELRNQLVDSFKNKIDEQKKQYDLRLQRELRNQERYYESKIQSLKRKHEAELTELREDYEQMEDVEENSEIVENKNDDVIFVDTQEQENMGEEAENKENIQQNNLKDYNYI